ncbi:DDT domain-containing protein PTM-like [Aristolochia californica]|uniref:DDT domain-containing protein PTM-like n=1 Tax=Aristolochia californica TaxID=171875 RepID=UPI0035D9157E
METEGTSTPCQKRRGRSLDQSGGRGCKRRAIGRGKHLLGRYLEKEFPGSGLFLGKITTYGRGFYRVIYEDGDSEDLEYGEIADVLIDEGDGSDTQLSIRKQKIEQLSVSSSDKPLQPASCPEYSSVISRLSSDLEVDGIDKPDVDTDADSCSDSCESGGASASECPSLQPLPLPPSSGDLGVPEESVSLLFSVYNFLRSFSHQLFLSPFGLDSFVGCLNCVSQNTLLDAIYVSVMRALKRHLEMLASDGSEVAGRCLRRLDWSLLDSLTWSVFIVEYLVTLGYTKETNWRGFLAHALSGEFYSLPVLTKLRVLQILCDDVLNSAELRAEIDMRESSEAEIEVDEHASIPPEKGPRRVHPRYSKTSACKDAESMENIVEANEQSLIGCKVVGQTVDSRDIDDDGNSDECRLCGMDGTLICCDGCPSAYHSRCIALSKAHLPDGLWFCPECVVNKMGPTCSRIGKGLRGAEMFGVDPFERVFYGTCNYLLVLDSSMGSEQFCKYYCQNDVMNVLQLLFASEQYASSYSEICKGISQYWDISEEKSFQHIERRETCMLDDREKAKGFTSINEITVCSIDVKEDDHVSNNCESNVDNGKISIQESACHGVAASELSHIVGQCNPLALDGKNNNAIEQSVEQVFPTTNAKLHEQCGTESAGSFILPLESGNVNPQITGERSNLLEIASREDADSGRVQENMIGKVVPFGVSFKPLAYTNLYILGDFAASAAANLAILTSEKGKSTELDTSSNPKKVTSENVSLQVKAFAGASLPFLWPSSERKLIEVPRERCGWCLACKAPPSRKMGCLLNLAASNALRGAARAVGGLRALKNVVIPISVIAAYILNMEESLRGLIVGPFFIGSYRTQWRKHLETASTCRSLKYFLLELEENISRLAFSANWVKLVDDLSTESATTHNYISIAGSLQRRGPNSRRNKKLSVTFDDSLDHCHDWWRRGRLSKMIFMNGILPSAIIRKAARQGGFRKISSICYSEEAPKRSQQFAWRAAVELSKNTSQLALQVRCLDSHIKWSDLVRPDQISQEGKGVDVETAFAFRNAFICDKMVVERKIRYALLFGNQKYLPSRLMKNVIEAETVDDGEKLWFLESHVPLYLIKEYEEKAANVPLPSPNKEPFCLSKLQLRQLKAIRIGDIFSYLYHKGDHPDKSPCTSCQNDAVLRNAVKCSRCQGYCHKDCTIPSIADKKDDLEFVLMCKKCYHRKPIVPDENSMKQLKIKLSFQDAKVQSNNVPQKVQRSTGTIESHHELQTNYSNLSSARKDTRYGLVWKRNKLKTEDNGADFRLKHILLKGDPNVNPPERPICTLCQQPYDSNLMYICCDRCLRWYHADAVQLKEEEILDLLGFRCCKCRRKASPLCPYLNTSIKSKKLITRTVKNQSSMERNQGSAKLDILGTAFNDHVVAESADLPLHMETNNAMNDLEGAELSTSWSHSKEQGIMTDSNEPLLISLDGVEPVAETNMFECTTEWSASQLLYQSPQKLPVRRQIKQMDDEGSAVHITPMENALHEASSPIAEWSFPDSGELIDGENMEYEPQTYFSFTELLASEDVQVGDAFGSAVPTDAKENWDNSEAACDDSGAVCQAMPSYGSFEQYEVAAESCSLVSNTIPCCMCHNMEPIPDLVCLSCQLQIHSHCSPWVEPPSFESSSWKCGSCRDWR